MSLIFTARQYDYEYKVKIDKYGNLIFLDYDFEYDIAMTEFGEPITAAMFFVTRWEGDPFHTLLFQIEETNDPIVSEVLKSIGKDLKKHAINYYVGTEKWPFVKRIFKDRPDSHEERIERIAASFSHYPLTLADISHHALWLAARALSDEPGSKEAVAAYEAEENWQVRRFVDVYDALKSGKGWPPLEATP